MPTLVNTTMGRKVAKSLTGEDISFAIQFFSIEFTNVDACSATRLFSGVSPSAAARSVSSTFDRIWGSGKSSPRIRRGIS